MGNKNKESREMRKKEYHWISVNNKLPIKRARELFTKIKKVRLLFK